MENSLRQWLIASRGDFSFVTRPISGALLAMALVLALVSVARWARAADASPPRARRGSALTP